MRESAELFKLGVPGPVAYRRLEVGFVDVDEAGRLEGRAHSALLVQLEGSPKPAPALDEELAPLAQRHLVRDRPVIALDVRRRLHALHVAAWLAGLERTPHERAPVVDAANQEAHMDVIERVWCECPRDRAVFDLETEIGWDPRRLDR